MRRGGFRGGYSRWDRRDVGLKPENALSRAEQLIEVGKVEDANQALYDIVTDNQTRRRQWSKTYEGIMLKLMELSVQLRKPHMVKEALHKYRATCMQSNVSSLDEVVRYLVKLAEDRTDAARSKVDQEAVAGADDLEEDAMETPETLILEAAGNALTKERIDRQEVVPWMRFLWEVYRVGLDIVKSHGKLEICYHEMAARAFAFCIKYKRFMEFRRLCDMLRQHLNQLIHYPRHSPNDVKISDAETLQKFLETRFTQLSAAVELEHWQEAYRTIEDIHAIMNMSKSRPRPQHMSIYYDKLMQVFWVSGNYLYHAHALWKLYTLSIKQNKNLSAEDAKTLASRLVLAALSIPVYDAQSAVLSDSYGVVTDVLGTPMSENAARHARMASLLNYPSAAERSTLIKELIERGVADSCHEELKDVLDLLEGKMAPLRFSDRTKKVLAFVEKHEVLKPYTVPLRRVAIYRLLEQLGKVYDVMRLEDMKRVASFATYEEVEDTALTALKTRSLAVRFDHQNQCLRFESELFSTDGMRTQLGRLARRLALASKMLTDRSLAKAETASDQEVVALALEREKAATKRRLAAIAEAKRSAASEMDELLARRNLIESRKEEAERRTAEAVRQKKKQAALDMAAAEQARKAAEAKRRFEERQALEARAASGEMGLGGGAGAGAKPGVAGMEEDEEGDAEREARMTRERELELKNKRDMDRRIQQLAQHMNHIERATRQKQWDRLKELHKKEAEEQAVQTQEMAKREHEEAKERHARAVVDKARTARIMPELHRYLADLMVRVDKEFDAWAQKERDRAEAEEQAREKERQERIRLEEEEQARAEAERQERERAQERARIEEERLAKEQEEAERLAMERLNAGEQLRSASGMPRDIRSGPGLGMRPMRGLGDGVPAANGVAAADAPASTERASGAGANAPSSGPRRFVNSKKTSGLAPLKDTPAPGAMAPRPLSEPKREPAAPAPTSGLASLASKTAGRTYAPPRDGGSRPMGTPAFGKGDPPSSTGPPRTEAAPRSRPRFINSKKQASQTSTK